MTLNEMLKTTGKTVEDIKKIYHGKDNCCRCGCGGNYFYPTDKGFKRAINTMNKPDFYCFDVDDQTANWVPYINIPTDNSTEAGKCYTVYFD